MIASEISELMRQIFDDWDRHEGWAPPNASEKLNAVMKNWIIDLSDCLRLWTDLGLEMTEGELILAKTNLGSLVEGWLKFTYCVYYEDYARDPVIIKKSGKMKEPEKLSFQELRNYSRNKLWEQGDGWDIWVEKMQNHRNAIHSFSFRDIGDNKEFLEDCEVFYKFLLKIESTLPMSPSEAYECYEPEW